MYKVSGSIYWAVNIVYIQNRLVESRLRGGHSD